LEPEEERGVLKGKRLTAEITSMVGHRDSPSEYALKETPPSLIVTLRRHLIYREKGNRRGSSGTGKTLRDHQSFKEGGTGRKSVLV